MKKLSVGNKVILVIFIIFFLHVCYVAYGFFSKKEENKIKVNMGNSDIHFLVNKNGIMIHRYEIRSLIDRKENSLKYKKVLEKSIGRKVSEIVVRNYKSYEIQENKPYYLSISREGIINEPGVVMQSVNFCIKDHNIVYSEGNEENFVRECIN
ncbi:hypothetical protein MSG66_04430 [Acinetobacter sp. IK31]|uniref:hypothetical protein n=1 Tax=Acinetobacter sp. IK31 TaxID=2928895 RepID=UPI002D212D2E|nr:hypothetical protein [Acinetobacter sp. IK31]MEB3863278.1 hypothetical protein [Acinetobacter sp. IK31]